MSAARVERLVSALADQQLDAVLVAEPTNLRYLTGFSGTNGLALVASERRLFVTDFRYVDQAASEVPDFDRLKGTRDLLPDVAPLLSGRVGFDDAHTSVRTLRRLEELAPDGVELIPAGDLVEGLRAIKEPGEILAIREAAALADDVYEHLCLRGLVGRTERDVMLDLEGHMRERGAEPSFPTIVAGGPHGALPHASPRPEPIAADTLVVVDLGCLLEGYCSDCTRTFATGPLSDEAAAVYELVHDAQVAALGAVAAGVSGRDADAVARERIESAGHGERFGHGLGHGVGIEVHEAPRLSPTSDDVLQAGMVVTIEPGVYVSGSFGVRIEDLVVVTEDGREVLSGFPKGLMTLG